MNTLSLFGTALFITSSGSISLNSMPLPVHAMQPALASGASNSATKNCHSCRDPLRPGFCRLPVLPSDVSLHLSSLFSDGSTEKIVKFVVQVAAYVEKARLIFCPNAGISFYVVFCIYSDITYFFIHSCKN